MQFIIYHIFALTRETGTPRKLMEVERFSNTSVRILATR
jgi:hypothetical protein